MIVELRNRPLLILAAGLIVGLTLREYFWNWLFLPALILVLRDFKSTCLAGVAFLLGLLISPRVPSTGVLEMTYVDNVARVVSVPRLYLDRASCEIELSGHRLTMIVNRSVELSLGDRVRFMGLVKPLREGTQPFYLSHRVVGRAQPQRLILVEEGPAVFRAALQVRDRFVRFSHETLSHPTAAVVDALCFNVDGGLDTDMRDRLRSTGTIHIVSASGLHVLVLALAIDWLFGFLPFPRALRLLFMGLILAFYACAAGLQPAIVRSVLMAMIGLSAYLWQREADLLSSLALTAILYLLWVPFAIYDIGFQFSFITVAAFGLFGSTRNEWPKRAFEQCGAVVREAWRTTGIAFLATSPLIAFYFGFVSITAIPANLFLAPAVMLTVVLAIGAFALSFLWPMGGTVAMAGAVDPLVNFIRVTVDAFGNLSGGAAIEASFSGYWIVLIYALLLGLVRRRVRPA